MKKSKIVSILLGIGIVAAAVWFFAFRKKEKPMVLETERPQFGYISKSVTATGTIQPVDTTSVGTQVSGTIKIINADFNSKVKKGQLLAELDKSLFQAQVDQYNANLAVAQSQLAYQQDYYNREKMMYDSLVIAKQEFETATYQLNSAKANVESVKAQLESAEKNLSYCDIYSPIDGVVLTRNVSIGQTVAASFNTPTLFIIAKDISKMQVQAAVDEADIGNVTKGQHVTFTVDAYPDETFSGIVEEIRLQPTVSANVVTYTTIINAENNSMKLKPGMTANIIVYTQEEKNALLISSKAIKFKPDSSMTKQYKIVRAAKDTSSSMSNSRLENGNSSIKNNISKSDTGTMHRNHMASVWLKWGDSLVQKKIKTGLNDDAHVEVLEGLTPDAEVISGVQNSGTAMTTNNAQRSPFMPQRPGQRSGSSTPNKK
ncbi:MAG TPA: efflux RND transporter periplasmic adaptor subunit [Puia sp.]|nr:efflux RND transporter periplasmic adaptor subunit [Puia sp.]